MVAKDEIVSSIKRIDESLKQFAGDNGGGRVRVGETRWGRIHAVVGSDKFKGMELGLRQEMVWDYLRNHVDAAALALLYGVSPLAPENFDEVLREAERRAIGELGMFISGEEPSE